MKKFLEHCRNAAVLLASICLIIMGSADVFALCFSGMHSGGVAIHHATHHEASSVDRVAARAGNGCRIHDISHCIDIPLRTLTKSVRSASALQHLIPISTGTLLDADELMFISSQRPTFKTQIPAPSPPLFIQVQTFLN